MSDLPAPESDSEDDGLENHLTHPSDTSHKQYESARSPTTENAALNVDPEDSADRSTGHLAQKRRRVTRACDECRRKKIKCDGKRPCTHCSVYSYECTYDQPSNRRRNPDPRQVETLEAELIRLKKVLLKLHPDIDLDSALSNVELPSPQSLPAPISNDSGTSSKESVLESMVKNTAALILIDDEGHLDFYGHSSGRAFLRRVRDQFGELVGASEPSAYAMPRASQHNPFTSFPWSSQTLTHPFEPTTQGLPPRASARLLCENALDDACAVLRFVHRPSFYAMFDRVYDAQIEGTDRKFIPLLFSVLAVGALFATAEQSHLMTGGFENAIEQGSHWFRTSKAMVDITDIRDLTALQTVLFMVLFLQSSAKLSDCYAHIGICLSSALRMGLHRSLNHDFSPIEQESRKRIFWCIRNLDTYVGALLGLPKLLHEEDVDQERPFPVDDELITKMEIRPMPKNKISLMTALNAHSRLVDVLSKIVRYIYPVKPVKHARTQTYLVDHCKIREIERDLQQWMEGLPQPFKPNDDTPQAYVRIQHILRMSYAHIEMFLYRPFLHYASLDGLKNGVDKRAYACGAACVSVSRNIVHLTSEMKKHGLLVGSYWFYMYTAFFAINALVFYVLENPTNPTSAEILQDAQQGKDILATLASRSLAADRCTKYLSDLFNHLSDRLDKVSTPPATLIPRFEQTRHHRFQGDELRHDREILHNRTASLSDREPVPPRSSQAVETGSRRADHQSNGVNLRPAFEAKQSYAIPHPAPNQGVRDFGAMMFPSADPFDYPVQPMIALESQQGIPHIPNSAPLYSSSTEDLQARSFGASTTGYQTQPANAFRSPTDANTWPQQGHNPTHQGPYPADFSQLFGEDWNGWMYYGAAQ